MMSRQDDEIKTPAKMRHIYIALIAIGHNVGRGLKALPSWRVPAGRMIGIVLALGLALAGCGNGVDRSAASIPLDAPSQTTAVTANRVRTAIKEVSPPSLLQKLRLRLDRYRPQVSIVSPTLNHVVESDTLAVNLNVTGLPLFRDERFGLGPHLQLLLDDQPAQLVFDTAEPIVLTNLTPGTHTLRVFAVRPWSESFKNEGAFAQTTFHVYTKTGKNTPDRSRPLLTYNQPSGTYGAEPILLDFYLTNAPLHAIAQEFDDDTIRDWRVRVTVNGQSFTLDRWEPLYLKGVKPGQNWLQLELIDELGEPIENGFNSTVRLFEYDPALNDGLAELVNGSVSLNDALSVVGVEPLIDTTGVTETREINNATEINTEINNVPIELPTGTPIEAPIKLPIEPELEPIEVSPSLESPEVLEPQELINSGDLDNSAVLDGSESGETTSEDSEPPETAEPSEISEISETPEPSAIAEPSETVLELEPASELISEPATEPATEPASELNPSATESDRQTITPIETLDQTDQANSID